MGIDRTTKILTTVNNVSCTDSLDILIMKDNLITFDSNETFKEIEQNIFISQGRREHEFQYNIKQVYTAITTIMHILQPC